MIDQRRYRSTAPSERDSVFAFTSEEQTLGAGTGGKTSAAETAPKSIDRRN